MRPPSLFRRQVRQAFADAVRERGDGVTWPDVLPRLPVDRRSPAEVKLVRRTVENLAAAGELVRVGGFKPAGARVWLGLYVPAAQEPVAPATVAQQALERAIWGWRMP